MDDDDVFAAMDLTRVSNQAQEQSHAEEQRQAQPQRQDEDIAQDKEQRRGQGREEGLVGEQEQRQETTREQDQHRERAEGHDGVNEQERGQDQGQEEAKGQALKSYKSRRKHKNSSRFRHIRKHRCKRKHKQRILPLCTFKTNSRQSSSKSASLGGLRTIVWPRQQRTVLAAKCVLTSTVIVVIIEMATSLQPHIMTLCEAHNTQAFSSQTPLKTRRTLQTTMTETMRLYPQSAIPIGAFYFSGNHWVCVKVDLCMRICYLVDSMPS